MCLFLRSSSGGIVHNNSTIIWNIYYNSWSAALRPTPLDRNSKCGYAVQRTLLCRYYIILCINFKMYCLLYCGRGYACRASCNRRAYAKRIRNDFTFADDLSSWIYMNIVMIRSPLYSWEIPTNSLKIIIKVSR